MNAIENTIAHLYDLLARYKSGEITSEYTSVEDRIDDIRTCIANLKKIERQLKDTHL